MDSHTQPHTRPSTTQLRPQLIVQYLVPVQFVPSHRQHAPQLLKRRLGQLQVVLVQRLLVRRLGVPDLLHQLLGPVRGVGGIGLYLIEGI